MRTENKLALVAAVAATLALAGCNRATDENRTVGQKVDGAVAKIEQKTEEAKDATVAAANKVGDKTKDIGITAAVNAELARDAKLSAVQINVDTVDGKVTLRGTAPDSAARERATTLANSVSGVLGVDNQLSVVPRG